MFCYSPSLCSIGDVRKNTLVKYLGFKGLGYFPVFYDNFSDAAVLLDFSSLFLFFYWVFHIVILSSCYAFIYHHNVDDSWIFLAHCFCPAKDNFQSCLNDRSFNSLYMFLRSFSLSLIIIMSHVNLKSFSLCAFFWPI